MAAIVEIQMRRLRGLLEGQGLELEATASAIAELAREGFDPDFGARPLKRAIQRLVQDPLANMVLAGDVGNGARVVLDAVDGELRLTPTFPEIDDAGTKSRVDDVEENETKIVG
jgi:ATP-dependent Clp protease ATP-binding subunit ClpA